MDKSWMGRNRRDEEYKCGVQQFLSFAFKKASWDKKILCPCKDCCNNERKTEDEVYHHLLFRGILPGYRTWIHHGESQSLPDLHNPISGPLNIDNSSDMFQLLQDAQHIHNLNEQVFYQNQETGEVNTEEILEEDTGTPAGIDAQSSKFQQLGQDANESLYPGCSSSVLSFMVHLLHIKCKNKWSDKSVDEVLHLLNAIFPQAKLPSSFYEAKKIINALGLGYEKIDVCPQNCMLYWKERSNDEYCHRCKTSRWKVNENGKAKKVPAKVLRYFPLIPRLKRLYQSSKTSSSMRWHDEGRKKDGVLRHPADSEAWKLFDRRYPEFGTDSQNVRLGLASDGFNPFGMMNNSYSIWPIVLIPYNLPPWLCMKQESMMLSMIIPGEKGPGQDIDVFLQPLIDELLTLWKDGVETYDASSGKCFMMRAALMWTINDFPAYGYLSGWGTQGALACPSCADNTNSRWLKNSKKFCFLGHRRWLHPSHKYRTQKNLFDGTEEYGHPPISMKGELASSQLESFKFIYEGEKYDEVSWKKKSIFFKLPYWKHQMLRHNLDVMHIEKNVCENLIKTLLNIGKKKKENETSREDLAILGIRHNMHIQTTQNGRKMSKDERNMFLEVFKYLKLPDGYVSNISRGVNLKERKIQSLKTHDYHILMQDLLPIALRSCLTDKVVKVVIDLSAIFKGVCSKELNIKELDQLESRAISTLCEMEKIFPPSFFTVMVHLVIHIVGEAKVAGPVQYRWMYPIERLLKEFKSFVKNKAQPEGSIAERYIANECLTFCSRYLDGVETILNRPRRNPDSVDLDEDAYLFQTSGTAIGASEVIVLDAKTWTQIHRYVLLQYDEASSFREEFTEMERRKLTKKRKRYGLDKLVNEKFPAWFKARVFDLEEGVVSDKLRYLAIGPSKHAKRYRGMIINGIRFCTKERDLGKVTRNSGVVVKSHTTSYSSTRDQNPSDGEIDYFGDLTDILEVDYHGKFKIILFRCDWANVNTGVKKDKFGFTLVNFTHLSHTGDQISHDPFVLSSQAQQVLYVQDPRYPEWSVGVKLTVRDAFDVDEYLSEQSTTNTSPSDEDFEENEWIRADVQEDFYMDD